MPDAPIVAIGLLTQRDLDRLGDSFRGAIPVPVDGGFEDLLLQLDHVESERDGRGVILRPDLAGPDAPSLDIEA